MEDLLVRLDALPRRTAVPRTLAGRRIAIGTPSTDVRPRLVAWVGERFGARWRSECVIALERTPPTCVVALAAGRVCGFACFDVTAPGVVGPVGVARASHGRGVGRALVLAALHALRSRGHLYAVIGSVGRDTVAFYSRVAGAVPIPGSAHTTARPLPLTAGHRRRRER
jgi:GNAT superfamily N-acetyltransferase